MKCVMIYVTSFISEAIQKGDILVKGVKEGEIERKGNKKQGKICRWKKLSLLDRDATNIPTGFLKILTQSDVIMHKY